MKVVKCTQCGAKVQKAEDGSYVCEYCGSVIELEPAQSAEAQTAASQAVAAIESAPSAAGASAGVQKPAFDPTITYTKTGERYVPHQKKKQKWLAIVLCVTFGYLGAHRFYEGKKRSGIVYLCSLGLLFFGVIYDFIQLLSRPEYY